MHRPLALCGILLGLLVGCGCAKPRVWQGPRVDLTRYGTLGLVEFRSGHGDGEWVTRRFLASVHTPRRASPCSSSARCRACSTRSARRPRRRALLGD